MLTHYQQIGLEFSFLEKYYEGWVYFIQIGSIYEPVKNITVAEVKVKTWHALVFTDRWYTPLCSIKKWHLY